MMGILQLLKPVVYVKLSPDMVSVREVNSGYELSEPPLIAIARNPKERVLAVGQEAAASATSQGAELVNPFKHPRALLSDFTVAEQVMKHFVHKASKASKGGIFRPAPIVVLHPLVNPEGGFTQIEIRAMHEMALGAGARKVIIWHGRELSNEELSSLKFGSGGEILN
jgi:rod shape-determining protein MreB